MARTLFKARLKLFIARYELWWYGMTVVLYLVAIPVTIALFPQTGSLGLACLILFSGFTASIAGFASAIKSSDDAS